MAAIKKVADYCAKHKHLSVKAGTETSGLSYIASDSVNSGH